MKWLLPLAVLLALAGSARAVEPNERLFDPALEARARAISQSLRCLVCQNESIDESAAPLATDLRRLIRQQIQAGQTDDQIKDFLVARYGVFVLMQPPVRTDTYFLWFVPALLLLAGGGAICVTIMRSRRRLSSDAPTDDLDVPA